MTEQVDCEPPIDIALIKRRIEASEIIGETPVVELKDILQNCSGDTDKAIGYLGRGQDGFVMQIPGLEGQGDWRAKSMACKLFWGTQAVKEKTIEMLERYPDMHGLSEFLRERLGQPDFRTEADRANKICSSVAGFTVGAEIEPDFVDGRVAIVMQDEQLVGYLTPYMEGAEGLDIMAVPGIQPVIDRLQKGGVDPDIYNTVGDNAIQLPNGEYRIIDLSMKERRWETHPRRLRSGETRIATVTKVQTQAYFKIAEMQERAKVFQAALNRTSSGDETFTYEDQINGTAMVITTADVRNAETVSQTLDTVTEQLKKWGLPKESEEVFTACALSGGVYFLDLGYEYLGTVSDFAGDNNHDFSTLSLRFGPQDSLEEVLIRYYQATQEVQPDSPGYVLKGNKGRGYIKVESLYCKSDDALIDLDKLKSELVESDLPNEYKKQFETAESVDGFCKIAATLAFRAHQEISSQLSQSSLHANILYTTLEMLKTTAN